MVDELIEFGSTETRTTEELVLTPPIDVPHPIICCGVFDAASGRIIMLRASKFATSDSNARTYQQYLKAYSSVKASVTSYGSQLSEDNAYVAPTMLFDMSVEQGSVTQPLKNDA